MANAIPQPPARINALEGVLSHEHFELVDKDGQPLAAGETNNLLPYMVPKAFRLTLPGRKKFSIPAGVVNLPEFVGTHWFALNNNVTPYEPAKAAPPASALKVPSADDALLASGQGGQPGGDSAADTDKGPEVTEKPGKGSKGDK